MLALHPGRVVDVAQVERARESLIPRGHLVEAHVPVGQRREIVGQWHVGHRRLVVDAALGQLERRRQREDRLAVLNGRDPAGRERPAVAQPVDLVDDRHRGIAGADEVRVQGMDGAVRVDRASGGDQSLPGDLAAEHPLQRHPRAYAAEDVLLDRLEVEQPDQPVHDGLTGLDRDVRRMVGAALVDRAGTVGGALLSGHA